MQTATTPAMIASTAIGMTIARMIGSLSSEIRQEGTHCDFVKTESPGTGFTIRAIFITLWHEMFAIMTRWFFSLGINFCDFQKVPSTQH